MRTKAISVRLYAVALCIGVILSVSEAPSYATSTPPPTCALGNLSLGIGQKFSHMTQEQGDIYTLTNRGKIACLLYGYPRVSYYDKTKHVLPFTYTRSSSIYMTHNSPKTVLLLVGARAFFFVAGSTCQEGKPIEAVTIRVHLPNAKKPLIGRATAYPDSGGAIYYCQGATNHYERQLDVSPVRPDIHHF